MSIGNKDYFRLPKKLFEPGTEPVVQHVINYFSVLSIFGSKWDIYFENELNYIKSSPFGAFYRLAKESKFSCSQTFVHFLLANQLVTKENYEIWSLFGGQPIRFSLDEFEYITRLSCDHFPTINAKDNEDVNDRWNRMLKSKFRPSLQNLEEMALICSEWTREDRIRLAYLMILAGILLSQKKTTPLPRKYIELVRDIDQFEKYPWGRAAFEVLISSIHEVKDDLCNQVYVINGFIQILQIWGYEAIPLIAKKAKAHVEGSSHEPIMLKWKGSKTRIDLSVLHEYTNKVDVNHFIGNLDPQTPFSPRWSNEIQDPLVSNLIGRILFDNNFDKDFWVGHGMQVCSSSRMKERSTGWIKRKRISRAEDEELLETENLKTRVYFDNCIEKLDKLISDNFEELSTKSEEMNKKISELEKQVNIIQQNETNDNDGRKHAISNKALI